MRSGRIHLAGNFRRTLALDPNASRLFARLHAYIRFGDFCANGKKVSSLSLQGRP
jgi:hypothetical protein